MGYKYMYFIPVQPQKADNNRAQYPCIHAHCKQNNFPLHQPPKTTSQPKLPFNGVKIGSPSTHKHSNYSLVGTSSTTNLSIHCDPKFFFPTQTGDELKCDVALKKATTFAPATSVAWQGY